MEGSRRTQEPTLSANKSRKVRGRLASTLCLAVSLHAKQTMSIFQEEHTAVLQLPPYFKYKILFIYGSRISI